MTVLSADTEWRVEPRVAAPWGGTVLLLMLVVAMGHFNRIGITVAGAERIIPQYGVSPKSMGMVYSAFLLIYTLAMLPGGWFIDRFGARTALVLLGFSSTIFVALTGAVGLIAHGASSLVLGLIIVRGLLGLTNAPLHPGRPAWYSTRYRPCREASQTGSSRSRPVWEWPSVTMRWDR